MNDSLDSMPAEEHAVPERVPEPTRDEESQKPVERIRRREMGARM
jgi:hypothetical protein